MRRLVAALLYIVLAIGNVWAAREITSTGNLISFASALTITGTTWSVCFRVNPSANAVNQRVFDLGNGTQVGTHGSTATTFQATTPFSSTNSFTIWTSASPPTATWTSYCFVYNVTSVSALVDRYLNGALNNTGRSLETTGVGSYTGAATTTVTVGNRAAGDRTYTGLNIADLAFWDRNLTADEVAVWYHSGALCVPPPYPVFYAPLNGATAINLIGGQTASLTGTTEVANPPLRKCSS